MHISERQPLARAIIPLSTNSQTHLHYAPFHSAPPTVRRVYVAYTSAGKVDVASPRVFLDGACSVCKSRTGLGRALVCNRWVARAFSFDEEERGTAKGWRKAALRAGFYWIIAEEVRKKVSRVC